MDSNTRQCEALSAYVRAQDELGRLVDVSIDLRREIARLEAHRLTSIYEAFEFAVSSAEAFVSQRSSVSEQRELARRAVIAELAIAWRMSEYSMQRLISESYVLFRSLPATLAALRAGDIDVTHVRVIAHEVGGATDIETAALTAADAELAARAMSVTPAELRRVAKRVLERCQLDTVTARHERAFARRAVEFEPAHDGMAWLSVQLRAADALLVRDRLRQAANSAGAMSCEARTCAQLEADLARDLLLHGVIPATSAVLTSPRGADADPRVDTEASVVAAAGAAAAGGADGAGGGAVAAAAGVLSSPEVISALPAIRPTVHVTVPVLTLLELEETPGDLDGYGPIDPETARRLAAHASSFSRLLTDPIRGTVLDVDRRSYRVPADLRRWLQVRDETCRFPGCGRRAKNCEVDHSEGWSADHGKTAHDNLAHLCSNHHHLKHETSWSVEHLDDGVLEWTSLTGAKHRTSPKGDVRARASRMDATLPLVDTTDEDSVAGRFRPPVEYPGVAGF